MGPTNNGSYDQIAEQASRNKTLNDALSNRGLDAASRRDIEQMYEKGANPVTLAQFYADAQAGKSGMFKVRKVQQNEQNIIKEQPGRSQLLSLGKKDVLSGSY